jgi:anti-anti-sigma regulatory factor
MTNDQPIEAKRSGKTRRAHARPQAEQNPEQTCIEVERSGDWMPVEELRDAMLVAVAAGHDVTLNLARIEHLDASALQILLALETEQKKHGRRLELGNVSPHLRQWFEYAGAIEYLFRDGAKPQ